MGITRVTGQDARAISTTGSVVATYPNPTTVGNILIADAMANIAQALFDVPGWNVIKGDLSAVAQTVAIAWKIADGTETTVTATGTAATIMKLHIYEYNSTTGWPGSPLDQSNVATSNVTSVTSLLSGAITTTQADELIVIAGGTAGNTTGDAYNSSFNLRQTDATNIRLFDGDQIVSSIGTYSTTGSWISSVRAASVIASFKPVVATPPTPGGSTMLMMGV